LKHPAVILLTIAVSAGAQPGPIFETQRDWFDARQFRDLGSVSSVYPAPDGHLWVAERCGANSCAERPELDPVLRVGPDGNVIGSFGAGRFVWPHGIHVDPGGNIWVTDGRAEGDRGLVVMKFNVRGELLMTLGQPGSAGSDHERFSGPTDVQVTPGGEIFVADGHETASNNRIVKFSGDGRYLMSFGSTGASAGQFEVPHALAMDSKGRLFVADRNNNRIQIFDQDGGFIDEWYQFGRPSGLFIDASDTIYVSDNQSNAENHPGWQRGIRIGDAATGEVHTFIPDPDFDPARAQETGAHGVAADAAGNVYGAEVWSQTIKKYRPP
jgi:DNA-binding beta-propeller fold protein YncE